MVFLYVERESPEEMILRLTLSADQSDVTGRSRDEPQLFLLLNLVRLRATRIQLCVCRPSTLLCPGKL